MIAIDLAGKTALITGASQGLGEATARLLHRAGANVAVNYVDFASNRANAERLAAELNSLAQEKGDSRHLPERSEGCIAQMGTVPIFPRAAAVEADVADRRQVEAMFDRVAEQFGGVDIVVNNAGILRDRTVRKMSDQEWREVIDVNLTGVFNVCRAAAERLNDAGRIVNLASISGVIGFFGQGNYAAAKAGVIALTKVLCKELAKRQITVNAVAPGVVLTEMGRSIPDEQRSAMLAQIPLARFGLPEEVAGAILFLCSDLAGYISGQTLHVNGGWWG